VQKTNTSGKIPLVSVDFLLVQSLQRNSTDE